MLLERLTELTGKRGVSGDEGEVRDYLKALVEPLADTVRVDTMGNLFAIKDGGDADVPHIMLAAHMDEVGFLITHVGDDGLLRFQPVGGIDPRVVISKRVHLGKDRIPGVIGAKAIHLQSPADRDRVLGFSDLTIDIGCGKKQQAEALCPPGTYVTFDSKVVSYGDELVKSKALDDRLGCLALLRALEEAHYPGKLTCVFTVQEEVGLRGATVAAWRVRPDLALVLEGTTCNDLGKVPEHMQVTRLGQGPVLTFMDRTSITHPGLLKATQKAADENGIPWQYKRTTMGGTDAGAIQRSREGVATLTIAVPCRYIHSASSACSLKDVRGQQALLLAALERFGRENPLPV